MQRRTLLLATGAALATSVSGCTGAPSGEGDDETYTPVREREGELDEGDIVFDSTEIVEPDSTEDGHAMFYYVVRNESDVLAENVEIRVEFYDADGTVLFDHATDVGNIGPGSIERLHLSFPPDVTKEDVDDWKLFWSADNGEGSAD